MTFGPPMRGHADAPHVWTLRERLKRSQLGPDILCRSIAQGHRCSEGAERSLDHQAPCGDERAENPQSTLPSGSHLHALERAAGCNVRLDIGSDFSAVDAFLAG